MNTNEEMPLPMNVYNYLEFKNKLQNVHEKIMYLSLFVDSEDDKLKQLYIDSALAHNNKLMKDPFFYDAGFDLFTPNGTTSFPYDYSKISKVDFNVKCCAKIYDIQNNNHIIINHDLELDSSRRLLNMHFTPFYTYARSSISKTSFRLANNQGIIDAGYRGSIIGMFDRIDDTDHRIEPYTRMLQICAPNLIPIYVDVVETFHDLGPSTTRGESGFGSTGV
jgi:dUTPase